ncbi:MAG: hypothetical protein QOF51_2476 [Chloroflexota bacterium]|nr:hypothetical protein [Chloroflexota bacterium]
MPSVQNEGARLNYQVVGTGRPLVLIHGWGARGAEWDQYGWLAALGAGRRLLIPDVRGHGFSAKPHDPAQYEMRRLASDVLALLDAAGEPEADLFGYSMGASIALWTAVLDPGRVRAMVVGGIAGADEAESRMIGEALLGEAEATVRSEEYRQYAAGDAESDFVALGACLRTGLPAPPCEELLVYGGETLLAVGDLDRRREHTERIAGCLPGGRFALFEGADHMGLFGDERFKQVVRTFLDEVSPA